MTDLPLAFAAALAGGLALATALTDPQGNPLNVIAGADHGIAGFIGSSSSSSSGASSTGSVPTGALATPNASGYVNPFAAIKTPLTRERLDMGWDFHTGGAGDPILSIGDAVVTAILPNWYAGQPLVMTRLTAGPDKGRYLYYAEGLAPNVSVGEHVKAGQQIATTTGQPSGLEFGWGGTAAGATLQQLLSPGSSDHAGAIADSYHAFLTSLGV